MSDEPIDDDPEPEPQPENHDLRRLREKAKGADDARADAEAARRELAFVRAGIDPDDARQRYFVEGYKGDLTPDAIKAEATTAGFLGQVHTSEPEGMTDQERAAFAATTSAAAGGHHEPPAEDIYAPFRNQTYRTTGGEPPETFGARLAQTLAANGGEVAFDGPFREFPGDTGIVPRPGTPYPKRI